MTTHLIVYILLLYQLPQAMLHLLCDYLELLVVLEVQCVVNLLDCQLWLVAIVRSCNLILGSTVPD